MKKLSLLFVALLGLIVSLGIFPSRAFGGENVLKYKTSRALLRQLMQSQPKIFEPFLAHSNPYKIQIIYTQIDRDEENAPHFTHYHFGRGRGSYFYPASMVKLPVAALALEKLRHLAIPGLDRDAQLKIEAAYECQTPVESDPAAPDPAPTVGNYIRKMLIVSDNGAYNRLYEFLGQQYLNQRLWKLGYQDARIITRLEASCNEKQNRCTNPMTFFDKEGATIYQQPLVCNSSAYSNPLFSSPAPAQNKNRGKKKNENDYTYSNCLPLEDAHRMLLSVMFPQSVPKNQSLDLSAEDYLFLRKTLAQNPGESNSPIYDSAAYPDNWENYLFFGKSSSTLNPGIRIYNIVGMAYGYLADSAYFVNEKEGIEFFLSAVIYTSGNGGKTSDEYEYDAVGWPFMSALGQFFYDYEKARIKKHLPIFEPMNFNDKQ